jgi:large subunit ribosomal protein L29
LELDELKQMAVADLRVKEREAREEIFRLRLKLGTNQLDNASNYRKARRELARILTLIAQKSAGSGTAGQVKQVSDAAAG